MATWTGEEVALGLQKWLSTRAYQAATRGDTIEAEVTRVVLDDATSAFDEGWMPWQDAWLKRDG